MTRFFLLSACVLAAASAAAQTPADAGRAAQAGAKLVERFKAADVDGDGRLTRDEAKAKMPQVYKHFDEIDTAHNGWVTLADIAAYARSRRGAREPRPATP